MSENKGLHDHLELIAEMGRQFVSSRDLPKVLKSSLVLVATHLHAEAASIFLFSDDRKELVCKACLGPIDINGLRIPAGHGIIGRTVELKKPEMVRDVSKDEGLQQNL